MQRKFTYAFLVLVTFLIVVLTGCSDQKAPLPGFISEEKLASIIDVLDESYNPVTYGYEGKLNYFDYADDIVPRSISKRNVEFEDSKDVYNAKCSSYYLRLPLHITKQNWTTDAVGSDGLSSSTRYQLEAKIYRPESLDELYYYEREDGGFILRAFGVNKGLIIKRPSDITCRGKWNIEIEYDARGFLVREYFATVNASESNKSECCNGEATYTYA